MAYDDLYGDGYFDMPYILSPEEEAAKLAYGLPTTTEPTGYDASTQDTRTQEERIAAYDSPVGSTQYDGTSGRIDNTIGDTSDLEQQLRDYAASAGVTYDPSDLEGILRNTGYQTGGSTLEQALATQLGIYDDRARYDGISVGDRGETSGYTTGTAGAGSYGSGGDALSQFLQYLTSRQSTADGYQSQLRDLLLNQIGAASQPVSANDPGIKQALDAMALESQRTAERQQSALAARLAAEGLGDSGAMDTGILGIEQQRGEANMRGTADVLYQELNNRRTQLTQLLNLAVSSGDAQAAQAIQAQIAAITLQLQNQQYYAGLGQQRYQFDNDLGFRLLMAQMLANQNAVGPYL